MPLSCLHGGSSCTNAPFISSCICAQAVFESALVHAELMEPCHERLIEAPTQGHLAPVRACIEARAKLVAVLRDHPATSDRGKKATYTYILAAQKLGCRRRHTQDR